MEESLLEVFKEFVAKIIQSKILQKKLVRQNLEEKLKENEGLWSHWAFSSFFKVAKRKWDLKSASEKYVWKLFGWEIFLIPCLEENHYVQRVSIIEAHSRRRSLSSGQVLLNAEQLLEEIKSI